jgi:ribosome-associated protein
MGRGMAGVVDNLTLPEEELRVEFTRSSGPGGQNVNRRATKVRVSLDVASASFLTLEQRTRVQDRLRSRMSEDGVLSVSCDATRSQLKNRRRAVERLASLLCWALRQKRPRIKTKVSANQKKRRLETKRRRSQVKGMRRKVNGGE